MSAISTHYKEFYQDQYPLDIYETRNPPPLPIDVEQVVNLDKVASKYFFKNEEKPKILESLFTEKIEEELTGTKKKELNKKGFTALSRSCSGTVWEHPDLSPWIIKAAASSQKQTWVSNENGFCSYFENNNLHRPILAERMQKAVSENKWNFVISEERLVRSFHASESAPLHKKYFSFCKKLDLLSPEETVEEIGHQPPSLQRRMASQTCDLIKRTGFVDTSLGNIIALRKKDEKGNLLLAFIDPEPLGLMKDITDKSTAMPLPFDRCVSLGLSTLKDSFGALFSTFKEEIELAQEELKEKGVESVKIKRRQLLDEARKWQVTMWQEPPLASNCSN